MELVFIHPNDKQRSIYRIYLENILDDCKVYEFFNYKAAQAFLTDRHEKNERPCDFVIASTEPQNNNDSKETVNSFYLFCEHQLPRLPFITIGERMMEEEEEGAYLKKPLNKHIQLPISPADFREVVLNFAYPDRMRLEPIAAFQKVRLFNFYRYNKTQCNVYIKLSRLKYVKVLHQGAMYSKSDLNKLKNKDIEFLYIRNDDFQRFQVNYFHNNFLEFDAELASPQELKEKLEFTHAMLQEIVTNLGFSKDAIELTEKSLQAINGIVEKDLSLNDLLGKFNRRDDYLYDHSYLTSIVACDLLRRMNWYTEDRMMVIGFASLFHDITLNNSKLAKVTSGEDERLNQYTEDVKKKYLRHPLDALELILEYPNIPQKVGVVICQHHESPEGTGFPNELRPQNIDPLSAVFILAHEFVNQMDKVNFDPRRVNDITSLLAKRFSVGHFKRPMDAFLEKLEVAA